MLIASALLSAATAGVPAAGDAAIAGFDLARGPGVERTEEAPPTPAAEPGPVTPSPPAPPAPPPVDAMLIVSQFLDAPVAGDADGTVRYGAKIDGYINVLGSIVGIGNDWSLQLRPEARLGESANGVIGLLPTNTALFLPEDGRDVVDLSATITHRWNSGATLSVGKVNALDISARFPVIGGGGHEGFSNIAFALPPSSVIPNSVTGAFLNVPTDGVEYRAFVFDVRPASRRSNLDGAFSEGVGLLLGASIDATIAGLKGVYTVRAVGTTRSEVSEELPLALTPPPGFGFGEENGEFSVALSIAQNIVEHDFPPGTLPPGVSPRGIGVFGAFQFTTGDPSFIDISGYAGISGNPKARPFDRFGIGWFRYSLTDDLVDALARFVPIEDEEGVEAFYTLQLPPSIPGRPRLTANVQYVDGGIVPRASGVVAGLRLFSRF